MRFMSDLEMDGRTRVSIESMEEESQQQAAGVLAAYRIGHFPVDNLSGDFGSERCGYKAWKVCRVYGILHTKKAWRPPTTDGCSPSGAKAQHLAPSMESR